MTATRAAADSLLRFEFRATGGEYFRIWIVNLLLTILTLGIYSAWAKVRRLRYLYGSTSLAGSAFEYHGQPLQILKGRLIAAGALIVYALVTTRWPLAALLLLPLLLLAVPWVIVQSRRFQMHMSSWRNIRFGFDGTYGGAMAAYVGWALLAMLTLYLAAPLWIFKRVRYLLSNTRFGTQRFEHTTGAGRYFAFYYILLGIALVAVLGLSLVVGAAAAVAGGGTPVVGVVIVAVMALAAIGVPLALGAYWERSFVNAAYEGLVIGPHRLRCQVLFGRLLWLYVTNVLGMLLTLGLFYPWALIRRLRYQIECMGLETEGTLDSFVATATPATSATGEAVGEFFEVDLGL
ncbi:MAG: YjgN family protein [Gammaproteobacteria bacterium]